jgi:prolyl oligopeptidase
VKLLWLTLALGLPLAVALGAQMAKSTPTPEDPYLWLEDISGEKALEWVKARNAGSGKELAEASGFAALKAELLEIMDSKERIPFINKQGPHYYNFWKDAKNPQGLWRRTTLEEYRKPEPKWDVLIDLDALNKAEKENWVWQGSSILKAGGWRHVLVNLSRGGADAIVVREYDLETRSFVKGGFELPESKGVVLDDRIRSMLARTSAPEP